MERVSKVARRKGAFEDLVGAASCHPWRISLILAVATGLLLHLLAVSLKSPRAPVPSDLGSVAALSLLATVATFLQWIIPLAFIFAAIVSYIRRSRAWSGPVSTESLEFVIPIFVPPLRSVIWAPQ